MYVAPWVDCNATAVQELTWKASAQPQTRADDGYLVYKLSGSGSDVKHRRREAPYGLYERTRNALDALNNRRQHQRIATGIRPPDRQRRDVYRLWRQVPAIHRKRYERMVDAASRLSSAMDAAVHDVQRNDQLYAGILKQTATLGYSDPLHNEVVEAFGVEVAAAKEQANRVNEAVGRRVVQVLGKPVTSAMDIETI